MKTTIAALVLLLYGCGGSGGGGSSPAVVPEVQTVVPIQTVAFIGDSITAAWNVGDCIKNAFNAGVPGNTTLKMSERFQSDVIGRHPVAVVIMGGTNDMAGGAFTDYGTDKVRDMALEARKNAITPIIATIPPMSDVPTTWGWGPNIVPEWNARIKAMAATNSFKVVDYYPLFLKDGEQNMSLYDNPTHPNKAGDDLMCEAVRKVL